MQKEKNNVVNFEISRFYIATELNKVNDNGKQIQMTLLKLDDNIGFWVSNAFVKEALGKYTLNLSVGIVESETFTYRIVNLNDRNAKSKDFNGVQLIELLKKNPLYRMIPKKLTNQEKIDEVNDLLNELA